ncbi:hypothetical protein [Moritella yayanosii]|uniref:Uncharacterized protein n=1 Tax=Moritella yayanosii TaxID=69539 RepID=A0A330LU79_9GAMM|nr:hypothetical protein [Moritella yayanosii]SQD80430.1 protein of unknown function [Moritella yayanosii]
MEEYMKDLLSDARSLLESHGNSPQLHKQLSNLLNRRAPNGTSPFSLDEKLRGVKQKGSN